MSVGPRTLNTSQRSEYCGHGFGGASAGRHSNGAHSAQRRLGDDGRRGLTRRARRLRGGDWTHQRTRCAGRERNGDRSRARTQIARRRHGWGKKRRGSGAEERERSTQSALHLFGGKRWRGSGLRTWLIGHEEGRSTQLACRQHTRIRTSGSCGIRGGTGNSQWAIAIPSRGHTARRRAANRMD